MKHIKVNIRPTQNEDSEQHSCTIDKVVYGEFVRISINGEEPALCIVKEGSGCIGCYIGDNAPSGHTADCPVLKGGHLACVWSTVNSIQFMNAATILEDL